MEIDLDLFIGIDFGDVDTGQAAPENKKQRISESRKSAALAVKVDRHQARRAKSEASLAEILPAQIAPGTVWHVLSSGDIDSLSYLTHIARLQPLDSLIISTWAMAEADVACLSDMHDAGRIGRLDCYLGEVFPTSRIAEYIGLRKLCDRTGGRLVISRNHSKVIAGIHHASGYAVVIESSANVNTNPRSEQTTITVDRGLYDFYANEFRKFRNCWTEPSETG